MQRSCPYISVIDVNFPRLSSCPPKFAALKTLQKERERERERVNKRRKYKSMSYGITDVH
jgi:hypothetical protein